MPVLVNPRQVRDFARAFKILAKTDRIDAAVLARFAERIHPQPLGKISEKQQELEQLVSRRRQLVDLRTVETNHLEATTSAAVRKSIQQIVDVLNKNITTIEKEILAHLESNDDW